MENCPAVQRQVSPRAVRVRSRAMVNEAVGCVTACEVASYRESPLSVHEFRSRRQRGRSCRFRDPSPRHTWSVRSVYSLFPQSRRSSMRASRDAERVTEGLDLALSAGVTGGNSPRTTNQPGKTKIDRAVTKIFFFLHTGPGRNDRDALIRAATGHFGNSSSCCGVLAVAALLSRRSLSMRRWIRCWRATGEWPLRRESS